MDDGQVLPIAQNRAATRLSSGTQLVLGIDTCGPSGSVALGRLAGGTVALLEQIELEGRSYSATLVTAVAELLAHAGAKVSDIAAIVAVKGPGSFTGVRVGLSAVKGLAEAAKIPVTAVSRLEVLAWKANTSSAALDAHRGEIFLRLGEPASGVRELLAGPAELAGTEPAPGRVAVCDDGAARLIADQWPNAELVTVSAPTAADALQLCGARFAAGDFVDLELLDGHYLRRSDAEIFGEPARPGRA